MSTLEIFFLINYIVAFVFVLDMVFISKKKFERVVSWALFLLVPFVGPFFYLTFGAGLSTFQKRMIKKFELSNNDYKNYLKKQIKTLKYNENQSAYPNEYKDLIMLNFKNADSVYLSGNNLKYYLEGKSVIKDLMNDIKNAKSSIHLEFYIFAHDKIGKKMIALLTQKAKEGVEVRLLYDAIGSIHTNKLAFRKFKKAGGLVSQFFPPFLHIKYLNFKANYRNHRKICVIDGKVAYTGGFNIRDDHMGDVKRLSPWRDTSVRILGESAHSFQNIFLSDWRFATKDFSSPAIYENEKYFPQTFDIKEDEKVPMQVLTSGPNSKNEEIKICMVRMIASAKKSIKIQTPYFIPDETFLGAIKLALLSGVKVEIIFPKTIDHWHVHYASFGYLNDLLKYGLKVYVYNGFIHSKVLMVDDEVLTLGSCNIDRRSFSLNFEDNIVIFDKQKVQEYANIFEDDKNHCVSYAESERKSKNFLIKLIVSFCRLFSAIL